VGAGYQPRAMDPYLMSAAPQEHPPATLWCHICRRHHPMPHCEVCGVEMPDLPHRLVIVCEPCKVMLRERRKTG
jgi:hypothetical protein